MSAGPVRFPVWLLPPLGINARADASVAVRTHADGLVRHARARLDGFVVDGTMQRPKITALAERAPQAREYVSNAPRRDLVLAVLAEHPAGAPALKASQIDARMKSPMGVHLVCAHLRALQLLDLVQRVGERRHFAYTITPAGRKQFERTRPAG